MDTPTTSSGYNLRPRPSRTLPTTRLPTAPGPAASVQPSAPAAFESTVPREHLVLSPGADGSVSQHGGQFLPRAAASPAAPPSGPAPAPAMYPQPPHLGAPYATAPVHVQYIPVPAMGDWMAGVRQFLWPGQCARGFAFRRWHRGAIQGLRAAVEHFPDGTITPTRLLQALRSVAEADNNYVTEYAQWLDYAIEYDDLHARALQANAYSVTV